MTLKRRTETFRGFRVTDKWRDRPENLFPGPHWKVTRTAAGMTIADCVAAHGSCLFVGPRDRDGVATIRWLVPKR